MIYLKKCGLLGEKLAHSYSPKIHSMLSNEYTYELFECPSECLGDFLINSDFYGLNVTVPYKKSAVKYCSKLSKIAKKLGSINTIVKCHDGNLYGDNTDYFGFEYMLFRSGVDVYNKKILLLGSGGASVSVKAVLENTGANVIIISRSGNNNYANISKHCDAQIIVNTTPVGMYPDNINSPIDLSMFSQLNSVFDIIYNPARTALMLQAECLGIKNFGGLSMLVAQAKNSAELFSGHLIDNSKIEKIIKRLSNSTLNIILVDVPQSSKSTISKLLQKITGRVFVDLDEKAKQCFKLYNNKIISHNKNDSFSDFKNLLLAEWGKKSSQIIFLDSDCFICERNYLSLHQNGIIFWFRPASNHLLIDNNSVILKKNIYELYSKFADFVISGSGSAKQTVDQILNSLEGLS